MFALKLFVTCAVVCCVLSETEVEKLGRRFCADTCNNVGVVQCGSKLYDEWMDTYDKCLYADEKGFSSVEEFNKFYCEDASHEEFLRILNCFFDTMLEHYTKEEIYNAAWGCLREYDC